MDRVDRDRQWSSMIPEVVQKLIDEEGSPRRISMARVFREGGFTYLVSRPNISEDLPQTMALLQKHVESSRAFRLRKLVWLYLNPSKQSKRLIKTRICDRCCIPKDEFEDYRWLAGFPAE